MTQLTATKETNALQSAWMQSKAMCAYANWMEVLKNRESYVKEYGEHAVAIRIAECESEYQTTARCIDMFVEEPLHTICRIIVDDAVAEFGITE